MKKILALSLFAVAAFVSQAGATVCVGNGSIDVFCKYDSGCWPINSQNETGTEVGCSQQAEWCSGGIFSNDGCTTAFSCDGGGFSCYSPSTTGVGCDYGDPSAYGCGGCWPVASAAVCTGNSGVVTTCGAQSAAVTACDACPGSTPAEKGAAYMAGTCGSVPPSPILTLSSAAASNSLSSMQSAVNLQVASGTAMLSIYDMKGKVISSQRVWQGNHVIQLQQLPRGLYMVQASNGSWKQTIKITIK